MSYELYTSYLNIKTCEKIDTSGMIVVVFYPNVTVSEAYEVINSTGGKVIDYGEYYIGNNATSEEKSLNFVVKVTQGEEEYYIEIYKKNREVYDSYLYQVTC